MTKRDVRYVLLIIAAMSTSFACDRDPLLAPVASTISVFTADEKVAPGGSTEIAAVVVEEAGTAVHDGTLVRFSATLGRVDPAEATTIDGVARTTFTAGSAAGTAKVTATSGAAAAGDPGNVVEITIG
jgi:hypothetical protein